MFQGDLASSTTHDGFDEEMAKNDAFRQFESVWGRWLKLSTFRRQSAEHTTGRIDWRKANCTKDRPVWASGTVPIATDPNKYDLSVLLALNPIKVYESIIPSAGWHQALRGQNMVGCPGLPSLS